MELYQGHSHEANAIAAAQRIAEYIRQHPSAVIGLATGETPKALYNELVWIYHDEKSRIASGEPIEKPLSFANVTFFTLDEYVGLPQDHPESYHSYLYQHLFDQIDAKPENIHIPNGNAPDIAQECRDYEADIVRAGGVDIWIAGIGENGHIAFNEPGSRFTGETRKVSLTEDTRRANSRFFGGDINKVPTHAISVGLGTLKHHAEQVFLLASGEKKASAVDAVLQGKVNQEIPATMLTTMRERVTIFADDAALATHKAREAGRGGARLV